MPPTLSSSSDIDRPLFPKWRSSWKVTSLLLLIVTIVVWEVGAHPHPQNDGNHREISSSIPKQSSNSSQTGDQHRIHRRSFESVRENSSDFANETEDREETPHRKDEDEGDHVSSHGGVHVAEWRWEYVKTPFVYTAFVIAAGLCKIAYHHADFLSSIIPESCLLIVLGTAVGSILFVTSSEKILPQFDSRTFFLFLLPPIILESAYSLHDRAFFNNLGTILLYAVVGTLLNCFTIGAALYGLSSVEALGSLSLGALESLVFSALISAVDPVAVLAIFQEVGVHKELYFLVFGESLLNDAVTVVLYTMMVALSMESQSGIKVEQLGLGVLSFFCVSLGGLAIGIFMGVLTALITKKTHSVRVVEPLAMLGIAYLAYLLAEMVHFSGIISIIGCGLVQAQYALANISQKSYTTVKYFSKMISAVCDTIIFLFLGMVLVNDHHMWNTAFVLWSTLLCLIFRFIGVLVLTYVANSLDRVRRINMEEQFIMAYGGLRGAVAFSLVIMLDNATVPNKEMFKTTTLFIILFTVFIQGGTIKPLVNLLKIRLQTSRKISLFGEINNKVVDSIMAGIEEVTGSHGDNHWKHVLYKYDEKYLKRWLQRDNNENALTRVYTKMVLADHFAHLYGPATVIEDNQPLNISDPCDEKMTDEEILSVTCPPLVRTESIRPTTEKYENRCMSTTQSESHSPLTSPKRRNTLVSPLASLRRRGTTAPPQDNPAKLLQRALQDNPYYKFHQKYNPNLVEDDDQELLTHLRNRRMRARRLTLAAMNSLGSSTSSSTEDLRTKTGEAMLTTASTGAGFDPSTRPSTVPNSSFLRPTSPINDQTITFLLDRAHRRRSVMSRKIAKMERADTIGAVPSADQSKRTGSSSGISVNSSPVNKNLLLARLSSGTTAISFGSLDSIGEIANSPNLEIDPVPSKPAMSTLSAPEVDYGGRGKFRKSLTFDVASEKIDPLADIEDIEDVSRSESRF